MSSKTRDRILSSIELALGFPPKDETLLCPERTTTAPRWLDPQEPRENLRGELEALSARFHRPRDLPEVQAVILSILKEHAVKRAVRWEHPLLEGLGIDGLLEEAGVSVIPLVSDGVQFFRDIAQADLGITAADAVLVESGTVVLRAQDDRERSTSLLPPVHLAIVTPGQQLRSIGDLVPVLRQWLADGGHLPSSVNLISGPSRTADIELNLVLGAHGPKALHVLEVDPAWIQPRHSPAPSS